MVGSVVPGIGTAIGALGGLIIGGAAGAIGGMGQKKAAKSAKKAQKAQEAAIRAEMQRRAEGIGAARAQFGDISSYGQAFSGGSGPAAAQDPSRFQNIGKTLNSRSLIQGQIDQEAGAVRDLGRQDLTGSAQQTAAGIRQASAARGLMGSSLDAGARQTLLGNYAGAKSALAGSVDATRQAGWGAMKGQQQAFESAAGGGDINPQMGAISTASMAAGARGQMGGMLAGNLLNQGLGALRYGALAEAQGGQGISALGLPKLGLAKPEGRRTA